MALPKVTDNIGKGDSQKAAEYNKPVYAETTDAQGNKTIFWNDDNNAKEVFENYLNTDISKRGNYSISTNLENGKLSVFKDYASISLDKNTGDIKVVAPQYVLDRDEYQQVIKPQLEQLSSAYKQDPNYKFASTEGEEPISVEQWVKSINDEISKESYLDQARNIGRLVQEAKDSGYDDANDKYAQVILYGNNEALSPEANDNTRVIVSDFANFNFFKNAESYDPNTRTISLGDFKNMYNRGELSDETILEMSRQLDRRVGNTVTYDDNGVAHIVKSPATRIGSFEDYATLVAMKKMIDGSNPGVGVVRGTVDQITAGIMGFMDSIVGGTLEIADFIIPGDMGINEAWKERIQDYEEKTRVLNSNALVSEAIGSFAGIAADLAFVSHGGSLLKLATVGNKLKKATTFAKIADDIGKSTEALKVAKTAEEIKDAAQAFNKASKLLKAENVVDGISTILRYGNVTDATELVGKALKAANVARSIANSARGSYKVVNELVSIPEFIVESAISTIMIEPDLLSRISEGDKTGEVVPELLKNLAIDTATFGGLKLAAKGAKKAGETTIGAAVSGNAARVIANLEVKLTDTKNAIKTAMFDATPEDIALRNIREGDTNTKVAKGVAQAGNAIITNAKRQLAETDRIHWVGRSFDEIKELTKPVTEARLQVMRANNAVDSIQRGIRAKMNEAIIDNEKLYNDLSQSMTSVTDIERSLGRIGKRVRGVQNSGMRLFSQETSNYISASNRLAYLDRKGGDKIGKDGFRIGLSSDEKKSYEDAQRQVKLFLDNATPELKQAVDNFSTNLKAAYKQFTDYFLEKGVMSRAEIMSLRETAYWGIDANEYMRTQRAKGSKGVFIAKEKQLTTTTQKLAGGTGDFADPMLVFMDWMARLCDQANRNDAARMLLASGDPTVLASSTKTQATINAAYKKQQAYQKAFRGSFGGVLESLQIKDVFGDVFKAQQGKVQIRKQQGKASKAYGDILKAREKKYLSSKTARAIYISELPKERLDKLSEQLVGYRAPSEIIDTMVSQGNTAEDAFQYWLSSVPNNTRKYVERYITQTLEAQGHEIPKGFSIFPELKSPTGKKSKEVFGIEYVDELSGSRQNNKNGYLRFGRENLSRVSQEEMSDLEEEFVTTFIGPGRDVDFWNGFLRGSRDNPTSKRTVAEYIVDSLGDPGTSIPKNVPFDDFTSSDELRESIAYSYFKKDYDAIKNKHSDKYGDIKDVEKFDADIYNLLVDKLVEGFGGNYTTNNNVVLYRGLNTGGNNFNAPGDFSWARPGASFSDNGFGFTTLSEDVAERFATGDIASGRGNGMVLKYHIPSGTKLFYYGGLERGFNNGGALVLPSGLTGEVGDVFTLNGIRYVNIYIDGSTKAKINSVSKNLSNQLDTKNTYGIYKAIADADSLFEQNIMSNMLSHNKEYRDSELVSKAISAEQRNYEVYQKATIYRDERKKLADLQKEFGMTGEEGWAEGELFDRARDSINDALDFVIDSAIKYDNGKTLQAVLDAAETTDELAKEYVAMLSLKKGSKNRKELIDRISNKAEQEFSESIKAYAIDKKMPIGSFEKQKNEYVKTIREMVDAEIHTRFSDLHNLMAESKNPVADYDYAFQEINKLKRDIGDYSARADVIGLGVRNGEVEYIKTSPLVAALVKTNVGYTQATGMAMQNIGYFWSKIFRLNTTGLRLKSWLMQLSRDSIAFYSGTGMFRTLANVADGLEDTFGPELVTNMKRFNTELYERSIKQLEKEGKTGEELEKGLERIAVQRELEVGYGRSGSATETSAYQYRRENYGALFGEDQTGGVGVGRFSQMLDNITNKPTIGNSKVPNPFNLNQRRERYMRKSSYANSFYQGMKKGYGVENSKVYAEFIMNNAITNFSRTTVHLANLQRSVPYLGAAINGTKSFYRMLALDPVGVMGRLIGGVMIPTMAITCISLSDEENRKVYNNIPEYEKADNICIVWNGQLIKIPIPQEMSSIFGVPRMFVEKLYGTGYNSFWELAANNAIGLSPIDLSGFLNLDNKNLFENNPTIWDNIVTGVVKMSAQLMNPALKTGVMLATGTDPYTGKKINTAYECYDADTNESYVMDYYSGEFAKFMGRLFGQETNAWMAQAVMDNLIGKVGNNILNNLVTMGNQISDGGNAGSAIGGAIIGGLGVSEASEAFTGPIYDRAQSAWSHAMKQLQDQKASIMNSKEYQSVNDAITFATSEEAKQRARGKLNDMLQPLYQNALNAVNNLNSRYGAQFTRAKFAAVLSLLNTAKATPLPNLSNYTSAARQEEFYAGRDMAIETMYRMGFTSPNDGSIFGYVKRSGDNVSFVFQEPLAILANEQLGYAQQDIHTANIKSILDAAEIKSSDMWDGYYKQTTKAGQKQYKKDWNSRVVQVLAPYIREYGVDTVVRNANMGEFLNDYIFVDYGKSAKNYIKSIFKED